MSTKLNEMPIEVTALIDQFLRDLTKQNVGVFGLVYKTNGEPAMTIIRNNSDTDPAEQAASVHRIIQQAQTDGRIDTSSKVWMLN
jgi:hypothetical protein